MVHVAHKQSLCEVRAWVSERAKPDGFNCKDSRQGKIVRGLRVATVDKRGRFAYWVARLLDIRGATVNNHSWRLTKGLGAGWPRMAWVWEMGF